MLARQSSLDWLNLKRSISTQDYDELPVTLGNPSDPLFLDFEAIQQGNHGIGAVGAKAKRLAELAEVVASAKASDFSVPPGGCLTTQAYSEHLSQCSVAMAALANALKDDQSSEELQACPGAIREAIMAAPLSRATVAAVGAYLRRLGAEQPDSAISFAVRSSGSKEDGAEQSFAGQYDTVLNVRGTDAVCAAVKRCWASQWGDHILPYLRTKGGGGGSGLDASDLPRMAVVIQQQVQPRCSGVLFTVHPTAVDRDSAMLVEAVWGLGEGLVSGQITPLTLVVDWATGGGAKDGGCGDGGGAKDGGGGLIVERSGGGQQQQEKLVCIPQGTSEGKGEGEGEGESGCIMRVPTTAEERAGSPLSDAAVAQLVRVGRLVSCHYGTPQDMEWCVEEGTGLLRVVQTRPVTSFSFSPRVPPMWIVMGAECCGLCQSMSGIGFHRFLQTIHNTLGVAMPSPSLAEGTRMQFGRSYCALDNYNQLHTANRRSHDKFTTWWEEVSAFFDHFSAVLEPQFCGLSRSARGVEDAALPSAILTLITQYTTACAHSWSMGHVASYWEKRLNQWLAYIHSKGDADAKQVSLADLVAGVSAGYHPVEELTHIARTHAANSALSEAVNDASLSPQQLLEACTGRDSLAAVGVSLEMFIDKYYWMADCDEDLATTHWVDDPSFPMTVFRQLAKRHTQLHADALAAGNPPPLPPPAAPAGEGEGTSPSPSIDPQGPTAAAYHTAVAALQAVVTEELFWSELTCLRRALLWKEWIHVMYVKIGRWLKVALEEQARRWDVPGGLWRAVVQHHLCGSSSEGNGDSDGEGSEGEFDAAVTAAAAGAPSPPPAPTSAPAPGGGSGSSGSGGGSGDGKGSLELSDILHANCRDLLQYYRRKQESAAAAAADAADAEGAAAVADAEAAADAWLAGSLFRSITIAKMWRNFKVPNEVGAAFKRQHSFVADALANADGNSGSGDSGSDSVDNGSGSSGSSSGSGGGKKALRAFSGLGCSAGGGAITARARVLDSLQDAHLVERGEILVTHYTSPAWGPLFSLISGIVIEMGGMLTHGAVVARECGIPCVSQISHATREVRSGDLLRLDGAAGTVHILERPGSGRGSAAAAAESKQG